MTINLITAVQDDGLVMCADSMLTLTGPASFSDTPIVTTFESAEKIIELGATLPAAAMISGAADIDGRLVSSFLRDASLEIDKAIGSHDSAGVIDRVIDTIDPAFRAFITKLKVDAADYLSLLDQLTKINDARAKNGLPPLTW